MSASTRNKINAACVLINVILFIINMVLFAYQGRTAALIVGIFNLFFVVACFLVWKKVSR